MRRTVLIVEDHRDTRELYALVLVAEGFEVVEAGSADDALEWLSGHLPDVIVTDVAMPGMDGIELCRRIRAAPTAADVPILVVTGQVTDQALVDVAAGGACALCQKPISANGLAIAVRALLAEGPRCYRCWENPRQFKAVRFGDVPGWMRHEPLGPDE